LKKPFCSKKKRDLEAQIKLFGIPSEEAKRIKEEEVHRLQMMVNARTKDRDTWKLELERATLKASFYEHRGFGGQKIQLSLGMSVLNPYWWFKFSSVEVPYGLRVTLFQNSYANSVLTANSELLSNFNDRTQYIEVATLSGNTDLNEIEYNLREALNQLHREEAQLAKLQKDLADLAADLGTRQAKLANLNARLTAVRTEITALETVLTTSNTTIISGVNNTQQTPQLMLPLETDSRGLETQGALLEFVRPASRLSAIETCEGNVQLSYFDDQGRMRLTNFDATSDRRNLAFEQWIPDSVRACLNLNQDSSRVTLDRPIYLDEEWTIEAWFVYPLPVPEPSTYNSLVGGQDANNPIPIIVKKGENSDLLGIRIDGEEFKSSGYDLTSLSPGWHHLTAVGQGDTTLFYIDGEKVGDTKAKALADAEEELKKTPNDATAKKKVEDIEKTNFKVTSNVKYIGNFVISSSDPAIMAMIAPISLTGLGAKQQFGKIAEVRFWDIALSAEEIAVNSKTLLTGNEPGLLAYYPLTEATGYTVRNQTGDGNNGTMRGASWWGCAAPIGKLEEVPVISNHALVSCEYSTVSKDRSAIMRRFFATPTAQGVELLPDKRIEELELKWIGNGQFAPTLLGYIEGAPPIPTENLTLEDNYNSATSVELVVSEDVTFSWNRAQDSGLGATTDLFLGAKTETIAGLGLMQQIAQVDSGFTGNLDFSYQFLNESSIASSSSLSMTDSLKLFGTQEQEALFPHLGTRFIPKNVGYALVVSATSDIFISRLKRSGKMIGYQVLPVENIPPDINTITFLINPAYTMNGSLDGLTGSSATSQRFFKHVPAMRSQFGSLYPASYYRLQEAYDLKQQIEQQDKNREAYFAQFNSLLVDETALARQTNQGNTPGGIVVNRPEATSSTGEPLTAEEQEAANQAQIQQLQNQTGESLDQQSVAVKQKRSEIEKKIKDQEKRSNATASFAGWQKKMEDIQIRAGKRNIVNTYVWDADGGLRAEAQSFANTAEHSIGGAFIMDAGLGGQGDFAVFGVGVELTAQATVNMTQTMTKTEARSKGIQLNVDLSGVESRGVTDYDDYPILPGEKVNRYRFMSFYLEGSTNNFHDFFSYVVDPNGLPATAKKPVLYEKLKVRLTRLGGYCTE
jgi:hypothetical protein